PHGRRLTHTHETRACLRAGPRSRPSTPGGHVVTLEDLKLDLSIEDDRDDAVLEQNLSAALDFAREVRSDLNWSADPDSDLPAPSATHELGVIRLAGRWFIRRRSPDALIQSADTGASRIPSVDPDIERMLGLGRYRKPVIA